jgi:hypothetical protein
VFGYGTTNENFAEKITLLELWPCNASRGAASMPGGKQTQLTICYPQIIDGDWSLKWKLEHTNRPNGNPSLQAW